MQDEIVDITTISEIRTKVINYLGIHAIEKISDIMTVLKGRGITRLLIVTGKTSYKKSGAWDRVENAIKKNGLSYELYDDVTPNPTVDQIDAAVGIGRESHAEAVLGIGGGSPIDAAKSAAILCAFTGYNARDLYEYRFTPDKALPIVTINLTHGTGTEVNRFAVASIPEKQFKPPIAYDCIYPLFSIDDPALMTALSREQTLYVTIDAMNHAIEAATTKATTPFAMLLAKEVVSLAVKYLPVALSHPLDLKARYFLTYAAMLAGISFDNGLLHCTHALEHPLSAMKPEVIHGYGLALLMPAMLRHIYPAKGRVLADILSPLVSGLKGSVDEGDKLADGLTTWLRTMGVPMGLCNAGFSENDIGKLTDLAVSTPSLDLLLGLTPVDCENTVIESMYRQSMYDYHPETVNV